MVVIEVFGKGRGEKTIEGEWSLLSDCKVLDRIHTVKEREKAM
jgi:hypothetical protein